MGVNLIGRDIERIRQQLGERFVAVEDVGEIRVSTVKLPGYGNRLSSPYWPDEFETMIFGLEDERTIRYSNVEAARRGHRRIVRVLATRR